MKPQEPGLMTKEEYQALERSKIADGDPSGFDPDNLTRRERRKLKAIRRKLAKVDRQIAKREGAE